jgi:uncharacterized membrane protein YhhN
MIPPSMPKVFVPNAILLVVACGPFALLWPQLDTQKDLPVGALNSGTTAA